MKSLFRWSWGWLVLILSGLAALLIGRQTGEKVRKASKVAEKANQDLQEAERHHEESNQTIEQARRERENRGTESIGVRDRIARINERMRKHASD